MSFIFKGLIECVIGTLTGVLDIFFSGTLGLLGVNLNVFEKVFPMVKTLNVGIITISFGIAFYIFIYQTMKNFNPSSAVDAESPMSLLASFVTTIIMIAIYRPLLNILLSFTTSSLTVLKSSELGKILKKGLASSMYDTFFDSLTKKATTSGGKTIFEKITNGISSVIDSVKDLFNAHVPEQVAAIILVAFLYSKLYKMMKIVIRTYVGVGILTYLAPLPLATCASRATKGYATNFIKIYIEHLISILLNCWFLRIIFNGFNAIQFTNLEKLSASVAPITNTIKPQLSIIDSTYQLFSVVLIWSLMVGAFIDYAVNINTYIERISGIGGLTDVPNSSQPSSVHKDSPVTKAVSSAVSGAADIPLSAMKRMARKGMENRIRDQIDSYKNGGGLFGFGGKSITPTNPSGNGGPGSGSGGTGAAMGGTQPTRQNVIGSGGNMKPYSPAAENSKQAGIYSLMNQPLSGKQAKKQMAEAMKDQKGLMDPYGEGKDYINQLKQGMGKEDQKKLDNSLVFDAGNDGMQIMSDIESDGNGKISASMNGENIELYSQSADADVGGEVGSLNASTDIGGETFMYDASQCPTFHKMMGGIDLYGGSSGGSSSSGAVGSPSSGSSSSMGGHSSGNIPTPDPNIYHPGSGQTYSDFDISGHPSGPTPDPEPSDIPNPGNVNTEESDVELF